MPVPAEYQCQHGYEPDNMIAVHLLIHHLYHDEEECITGSQTFNLDLFVEIEQYENQERDHLDSRKDKVHAGRGNGMQTCRIERFYSMKQYHVVNHGHAAPGKVTNHRCSGKGQPAEKSEVYVSPDEQHDEKERRAEFR